MNVRQSPLVLLLLLWLMPGAQSAQAEDLIWGVVPIPGAFNVRDGDVVDGWMHEAFQLLAERLPELNIRYEVMPSLRLVQSLRNKEELCTIGQLKSPLREQIAYFVPFAPTTPLHVIVRQQALDQFLIEDGYLSLDWLLANPYLRGGLSINRIYPESIRQRLQQGLAEGRLLETGGSLGGENILLMVSRDRLDYVFEYPMISDAVIQAAHINEPLVSVPLRENDHFEILGMYCPKTPWGASMAARLDQAIRTLAADEQTLMLYYEQRWPAEIYARYESKLRVFYRQRANAGAFLFKD
jgi:uncharacterized protein (TIGR02285 family)